MWFIDRPSMRAVLLAAFMVTRAVCEILPK